MKKYKKVVIYNHQDYGIIETPAILQRNQEINYIIMVDNDSKILLTFQHAIAKLNCSDPTFIIYLDITNSSDIISLCKQQIPWPIISNANFIRIQYRMGSTIEFIQLNTTFQKISGISI